MLVQTQNVGHTQQAIEQHSLVLGGSNEALGIFPSLLLKIGREAIQRANKSMDTTWLLLGRRLIINVHLDVVSAYATRGCTENILLFQILAVAQTISHLLSLWLTIVRRLRLMTVSGGISFGASESDSENGFRSLGSDTVASNLHHDT